MKKFNVTVEWVMAKNIEIEASNEDEAYKKAMNYNTDNGEYIEDSYEVYVMGEVTE